MSETEPLNNLKVAFLGLGIMGGNMAANLCRAGVKVTGWNRQAGRAGIETAKRGGVEVVATIREAVGGADFIFSCLGDEKSVQEVMLGPGGVSENGTASAIVVDFTTIGPMMARHIEKELAASGLKFIDAPVTGGDVGAREGTLTILIGSTAADFEKVKPLLHTMGKKLVHCGPPGSGQSMKLCNQVLCAVNMVAVCESLALAREFGLEEELLVDALSGGAGGSWALSALGARIAKQDFTPGFMLKHMLKDLRLIKENSKDYRALPGTALAESAFERAAAQPGTTGDAQGTQAMYRVYNRQSLLS